MKVKIFCLSQGVIESPYLTDFVDINLDTDENLYLYHFQLPAFDVTFAYDTTQRTTPTSLDLCHSFTDWYLYIQYQIGNNYFQFYAPSFSINIYDDDLNLISKGYIHEWEENIEDFTVTFTSNGDPNGLYYLDRQYTWDSKTYEITGVENMTTQDIENAIHNKILNWIHVVGRSYNIGQIDRFFSYLARLIYRYFEVNPTSTEHKIVLKTRKYENMTLRDLFVNIAKSLFSRVELSESQNANYSGRFSVLRLLAEKTPVNITGNITKKANNHTAIDLALDDFLISQISLQYKVITHYYCNDDNCQSCPHPEINWKNKSQNWHEQLFWHFWNQWDSLYYSMEYTIWGYVTENHRHVRVGDIIRLQNKYYLIKEIDYDDDSPVNSFEAVCAMIKTSVI